jgi:Icc-related predicted phosphoesterase
MPDRSADDAAVRVRVAAAGDVHADESRRAELAKAFDDVAGQTDLILLAGDLTTHGRPEEAAVLADSCRGLDVPVFAVLGNHDWHADRQDEIRQVLADGGVTVLERSAATCESRGLDVGVVGTKGFVGGFFPGSHLPDFGEPILRAVYAETSAEVEALEAGLTKVAGCPLRIVLLHYSPSAETLEGERREIWSQLGTDRLAGPIVEHRPDLVLHGHAHGGRFEGSLDGVPVFNVSVPVLGRDFWVFELTTAAQGPRLVSLA